MSAKLPFDFSLKTLYDAGKNSFDVAFCLKAPPENPSDQQFQDIPIRSRAHSCVLRLHGRVFDDVLREVRRQKNASSATGPEVAATDGPTVIHLVDVLPFVVTEEVLEVFIKYLYYGFIEVPTAAAAAAVASSTATSEDVTTFPYENCGKKKKKKLDYASYALFFKRLYLLARHFHLPHLERLCIDYFDSVLAPDKHSLDLLDFGRCYGIAELVAMVIEVVETSKSFFGDPELLALIRKG